MQCAHIWKLSIVSFQNLIFVPQNLSGYECEAEECFLGHRKLSFEAKIRSATLMAVIEKTYQTFVVLYISVAKSHIWKISILQLFFYHSHTKFNCQIRFLAQKMFATVEC